MKVCVSDTRSISFLTMSLMERITSELTAAMKAKDAMRTSVLRMAKSALKNREIEIRRALEDAEVVRVLQNLVRQSEEAVVQFEKGNRPDLAQKERAEIVVLRSFLPEQISQEEMEVQLEHALRETGATSPKELGRVMKAVLSRLQSSGKSFDGRKVNELVRKRLGAA